MLKNQLAKNGLTLLSLVCALLVSAQAAAEDKKPKQRSILGWVEYVDVLPWGLHTKAKLDTGAKTSSMHAEDIEIFEKKGKDWARYVFEYTEKKGGEVKRATIEAPVKRYVLIKRHKRKTQRRPVVQLELCLDNRVYKTEFSLIDRSRFIYPVLLGRRLLKKAALIDADRTFLGQKDCKVAEKDKD
ncbi:MAG: ATP-dependent zinc protease [Nevskiales bacterium]